MEEVERLSGLKDAEINTAKETLAYEVTKLVHGEDEAAGARDAARALFGGAGGPGGADGAGMDDAPTFELERGRLSGEGVGILDLMREAGLTESNKDGFRAIEQGGLTIEGEKVTDTKLRLRESDFSNGVLLIRRGKKKYCRVVLV
jgi:tyrosyl-tRNA synthetase